MHSRIAPFLREIGAMPYSYFTLRANQHWAFYLTTK